MTKDRVRISKRVVDGVTARGKEYYLWDADIRGFGIRVRPTGAATYVYVYRPGGGRAAPVKRLRLAAVGDITPDEARKLAREKVAEVVKGGDPAKLRADHRKAVTVKDLGERFFKEHVSTRNKGSTQAFARTNLDRHIYPDLGSAKARDLTRREVVEWHQRIGTTKGPYAANRALATLRKMMSFALQRDIITVNPATMVEQFPERRREAFADEEALQAIGAYLAGIDETRPSRRNFAAAVRLLALTGMRLGEVTSLKWGDVDLAQGLVRLPDAKAGARTVALPKAAVEVLRALKRTGAWVLPSANRPEEPLDRHEFRAGWDELRKATGLTTRPHDLRHGAATFGAQAGANAFILRDYLGHKTVAMTSRYVERQADPIRDVAETVGSRVAAALEGKTPHVVKLRRST